MSRARELLRERFGHTGFRPGQEALIAAVLAGRDALGVLPTGGGKSLCFQLPSLLHGGLTLVVSPLISLMRDQDRRAREVGIASLALHSAGEALASTELRAPDGQGLQMLFVAPERFASPHFRSALARLPLRLVAVDEAHCIASWGHDFRPSYQRLARVRPVGVPILAITATATPEVRDEICRGLRLTDPTCIVTSFDRPNLHWGLERATDTREQVSRIAALRARLEGAVLVYAGTRRRVATLRRGLADVGVETRSYHAGLPSTERAEAERWFCEGDTPTLVATNAFGMGIDRPDVRAVCHVDLPLSLEALYQEAGRAGRDGRPALAVAIMRDGGQRSRAALAALGDPGYAALRRAYRALLDVQRRTASPVSQAEAERLVEAASGAGAAATSLARLESLGVVRALPGRASGGPRLHIRSRPPSRADVRRLRRVARRRLRGVDAYVRSSVCRRRNLLEYFGERSAARCGNCDLCGAPER